MVENSWLQCFSLSKPMPRKLVDCLINCIGLECYVKAHHVKSFNDAIKLLIVADDEKKIKLVICNEHFCSHNT